MKEKLVGMLMGGHNSEHEVSLKTGAALAAALQPDQRRTGTECRRQSLDLESGFPGGIPDPHMGGILSHSGTPEDQPFLLFSALLIHDQAAE